MKTLAELVTYGTAEEMRAAYAPTPPEIRRLFTADPAEFETDVWLVLAFQAGATPLFQVPNWVSALVQISVPTIECYPSKSPGAWRVHGNSSEWYVSSAGLTLRLSFESRLV